MIMMGFRNSTTVDNNIDTDDDDDNFHGDEWLLPASIEDDNYHGDEWLLPASIEEYETDNSDNNKSIGLIDLIDPISSSMLYVISPPNSQLLHAGLSSPKGVTSKAKSSSSMFSKSTIISSAISKSSTSVKSERVPSSTTHAEKTVSQVDTDMDGSSYQSKLSLNGGLINGAVPYITVQPPPVDGPEFNNAIYSTESKIQSWSPNSSNHSTNGTVEMLQQQQNGQNRSPLTTSNSLSQSYNGYQVQYSTTNGSHLNGSEMVMESYPPVYQNYSNGSALTGSHPASSHRVADYENSRLSTDVTMQDCSECTGTGMNSLNLSPEQNGQRTCLWSDCYLTFDDQEDLVGHIEKVHVDQRRMSCEEYTCLWTACPRNYKPFNARYKLLIHMRVHSGEKPNKCTYSGCEKAFSRLENLKIHLRSHTGERPYICQHAGCGKAFSNSSDRAKHQRTHIDAKPYACQVVGCGKRYTDPSSLRKHLKNHSPHEDNTKSKRKYRTKSRDDYPLAESGGGGGGASYQHLSPLSASMNASSMSTGWSSSASQSNLNQTQQLLMNSWSTQACEIDLQSNQASSSHLNQPVQRSLSSVTLAGNYDCFVKQETNQQHMYLNKSYNGHLTVSNDMNSPRESSAFLQPQYVSSGRTKNATRPLSLAASYNAGTYSNNNNNYSNHKFESKNETNHSNYNGTRTGSGSKLNSILSTALSSIHGLTGDHMVKLLGTSNDSNTEDNIEQECVSSNGTADHLLASHPSGKYNNDSLNNLSAPMIPNNGQQALKGYASSPFVTLANNNSILMNDSKQQQQEQLKQSFTGSPANMYFNGNLASNEANNMDINDGDIHQLTANGQPFGSDAQGVQVVEGVAMHFAN